jgi:glycosyltransferase involved in cell wall biosynthesis
VCGIRRLHFLSQPPHSIEAPAPCGEDPEDLARVRAIIRDNRLEGRVQVLARFVSEQEKAELFSRALACTYVPYDEDSYGFVTLESYASSKPVITCTDSGGTDVVVKDGITGLVVAPEPKAIAASIDRLYCDRVLARKMGEAGKELVSALKIDWTRVVECLTQ